MVKLDTAQQIVKAAEFMGIDAELREDYSGRGMYGKATAAVVIGSWTKFAAAVAQAAVDSLDHDEVIADVEKAKWDNMGRSEMVIY